MTSNVCTKPIHYVDMLSILDYERIIATIIIRSIILQIGVATLK